jgi:hypothetical protein
MGKAVGRLFGRRGINQLSLGHINFEMSFSHIRGK